MGCCFLNEELNGGIVWIVFFFPPATSQVCRLGSAGAGAYPVSVSFPSLGNSRYADGNITLFTYRLIVSSFSPLAGSVAGTLKNQKNKHLNHPICLFILLKGQRLNPCLY